MTSFIRIVSLDPWLLSSEIQAASARGVLFVEVVGSSVGWEGLRPSSCSVGNPVPLSLNATGTNSLPFKSSAKALSGVLCSSISSEEEDSGDWATPPLLTWYAATMEQAELQVCLSPCLTCTLCILPFLTFPCRRLCVGLTSRSQPLWRSSRWCSRSPSCPSPKC